jgi:hypothetical protein
LLALLQKILEEVAYQQCQLENLRLKTFSVYRLAYIETRKAG